MYAPQKYSFLKISIILFSAPEEKARNLSIFDSGNKAQPAKECTGVP
jgi:hypothetical protein